MNLSFDYLKQNYNLKDTAFWKYSQFRQCLFSVIKYKPNKLTGIHELLTRTLQKKGKAMKFYHLIREANAPKLKGLRTTREKDVGRNITDEQWSGIVSGWYVPVQEVQSQLIKYKILNQCYWTPSKMAKLKLIDNNSCW